MLEIFIALNLGLIRIRFKFFKQTIFTTCLLALLKTIVDQWYVITINSFPENKSYHISGLSISYPSVKSG